MSDNLREQLARAMTAHHTVPWEEMPDTRKRRVLAYADATLAEFAGVRVSEPAPVSVREAARVLCGSAEAPFLEPASAITRELRKCGYLVPVRITHKALRAIAEGKE